MKKAYIMIGLPGSGKSTWINDNASCAKVLSTDNIIDSYCRQNNITYNEGFKRFIKLATNQFNNELSNINNYKGDIVIDQTNLTKKSRAYKLKKLSSYKKIAVVCKLDSDELQRRLDNRSIQDGKTIPSNIISSMILSYEQPTLDEFDEIIYVNGK